MSPILFTWNCRHGLISAETLDKIYYEKYNVNGTERRNHTDYGGSNEGSSQDP